MNLHNLLLISRPRFWIYLIGPFLIGSVAAHPDLSDLRNLGIILLGILFFSFPANFYIYCVNDIHDIETDKTNAKKQGYETHQNGDESKSLNILLSYIVVLSLGLSVFCSDVRIQCAIFAFFFFGHFYSAPPIRAKAKPFLDMLFNALYIMPALVGFYFLGGHNTNFVLVFAAIFWAMAMHAFSAIPDITADSKAGLKTVATTLGTSGTLLLCIALYSLAIFFSYPVLGLFGVILGAIYLAALTFALIQPAKIFQIYTAFPAINTLTGLGIFLFILLRL